MIIWLLNIPDLHRYRTRRDRKASIGMEDDMLDALHAILDTFPPSLKHSFFFQKIEISVRCDYTRLPGYMGICRAAPILCKSISIRWNVSSFLSNRSNITIDIWDFAWQHLYYLLSNKIAITTDVWDFAGQHVYYTMQVNSQQMQCFFLSFQHKQCYNGYMGLCKAAFILFALCFPIKSPSQ